MSDAGKWGIAALAVWLGLIAASILWLDKPWAEFAFGHHFRSSAVIRALPDLAEVGGAFFWICFSAVLVILVRNWRSAAMRRLLQALILSLLLAWLAKDGLKFVFSRTWPETWIENNPSWLRDGVFIFDFFHGGRGWGAFPSGHSTMISAPMTVAALAFPRWRWACLCPVLLVAVGLLLCDYHWVSDVLAGLGLGPACGLASWRLSRAKDVSS